MQSRVDLSLERVRKIIERWKKCVNERTLSAQGMRRGKAVFRGEMRRKVRDVRSNWGGQKTKGGRLASRDLQYIALPRNQI